MRALLMMEPGRLEVDEIPTPSPEAGWALIRVVVSGAGLFHVQMAKGMLDTGGLPRILGHEIVGEVVEASSPASPPPGSLVVVDAVVGCGVCDWCIRGEESICPWMHHLGIDLDGGFADYVAVPEPNIFALPEDVDLGESVMLSSALPSSVHAVLRAGVTSGDRVLVSGVGSIGFTVCQVARAFGATTVVAADISDKELASIADKVDATLNVTGMEPVEVAAAVRRLTAADHGVDVAFETAGQPASVNTTLHALRPGGTAMMMGICDDPTVLSFEDYLADFVRREVNLVTTFGFTRRDFLVGSRLFAAGRLDLAPLAGDTVTLEDIPRVLDHIEQHGTGGKRFVVDVGISPDRDAA